MKTNIGSIDKILPVAVGLAQFLKVLVERTNLPKHQAVIKKRYDKTIHASSSAADPKRFEMKEPSRLEIDIVFIFSFLWLCA